MDLSNVTLLIQTHYRHNYLDRNLKFHTTFGFESIIIADSSKNKYEGKLYANNVEYYHYPDYTFTAKINEVVQNIKTKYFLFSADDDLYFKEGLLASKNSLEENQDYVSVQGTYLKAFLYKEANKYNYSFYYPTKTSFKDLYDEDPISRNTRRYNSYFQNYYSLCKSEVMIRGLKIGHDFDINSRLLILFLAINTDMLGKSKNLPILYCCREFIEASNSQSLATFEELISEKKYKNMYNSFLNAVGVIMEESTSLTKEEAIKYYKKILKEYVEKYYSNITLNTMSFQERVWCLLFKYCKFKKIRKFRASYSERNVKYYNGTPLEINPNNSELIFKNENSQMSYQELTSYLNNNIILK